MTLEATITDTNSPNAGEAVETLNESVAEAASETVQNAGEIYSEAENSAEGVLETATEKERDVLSAVSSAQSAIGSKVTPVPASFDSVSTPSEIKARLDWGEPALSILDVRDRESFNNERIVGAMPMPREMLVEKASSAFEFERDIVIYSDSDTAASEAASQLRTAGFEGVSMLKGGLPAWKAINGATEGRMSNPEPSIFGQTATP